ncbi:MAG: hypothetical protein RDU30_11015 [Desulfovibrionaceae bacterium]|nr:hypothetical protein [Desulfovibrionaceae bacterium]
MQIPILGFHRSGTSAISQHLSLSGLNIGTDLLGPKPSNPFGHFEDSEIFDLQQKILHQNQDTWLSACPTTYIFTKDHLNAGQRITFNRDAQYAHWGFKDPRTCLLLDFWDIFLSEPRYVICLRHYRSCIDSILRREFSLIPTEPVRAKALIYGKVVADPNIICMSWCTYMLPVLRLLRHNPQACVTVQVPELDEKNSIAATLNKRFGLELTPLPMRTSFNPKYFKKTIKLPIELDAAVEKYADSIWNDLTSFCDFIEEVE